MYFSIHHFSIRQGQGLLPSFKYKVFFRSAFGRSVAGLGLCEASFQRPSAWRSTKCVESIQCAY